MPQPVSRPAARHRQSSAARIRFYIILSISSLFSAPCPALSLRVRCAVPPYLLFFWAGKKLPAQRAGREKGTLLFPAFWPGAPVPSEQRGWKGRRNPAGSRCIRTLFAVRNALPAHRKIILSGFSIPLEPGLVKAAAQFPLGAEYSMMMIRDFSLDIR